MKDVVVRRIVNRSLTGNNSIVEVILEAVSGEEMTLKMTPALAGEIINQLAALNDEAMVKGPERTGLSAGAYRKSQSIHVSIDATSSVLLLQFDADAPHRVGVALPIGQAEAVANLMLQWTRQAKLLGQTQKPQ